MADYTIKAGDAGSVIEAVLKENAAEVDLTGASVRFLMSDAQYGASKVNAPATIVTAAAGAVAYDWQPGDLDTAGGFLAEFEVTFADGSIATFPSAGYVEIRVIGDLN
jgi:hypothetical protein